MTTVADPRLALEFVPESRYQAVSTVARTYVPRFNDFFMTALEFMKRTSVKQLAYKPLACMSEEKAVFSLILSIFPSESGSNCFTVHLELNANLWDDLGFALDCYELVISIPGQQSLVLKPQITLSTQIVWDGKCSGFPPQLTLEERTVEGF